MRSRFAIILLGVVAFVAISASAFLFFQYQKAQNLLNNPARAGKLEAEDLVKTISRIMLLPKDEEPTVATVSDYKKLQDQPFFKNAHNGDKVLIYTKAKLAILFDPKQDKIIGVAPVNIGSNPEVAGANTKASIRIALYNGASSPGLTNTVEQQLKSKISGIVITGKANAKKTYDSTIVVDLIGNQQKIAADVAALLGGDIGNLPEGETVPTNSDLLIILGK